MLAYYRLHMHSIKSVLSQKGFSYYNILIWAARCVGDFGYLHCGEFLVPEEIDFEVNTHLSYHCELLHALVLPSIRKSLHMMISQEK